MANDVWFEELLPGKWPARFAITTIGLALSATGLPSVLPKSFLPSSDEQTFLLRLIFLLVVATLGSIAILVATAIHSQRVANHSWISRTTVATVVATACVAVLPYVLPSSVFTTLPERQYTLTICALLICITIVLAVLSGVVRHVRKIEAQANRSFWESAP